MGKALLPVDPELTGQLVKLETKLLTGLAPGELAEEGKKWEAWQYCCEPLSIL
jgi:hypothetical protein